MQHCDDTEDSKDRGPNTGKSSGNKLIRTVFPSPLFATAEVLLQKLSGPAVKVPPPVLQEDGCIDKEYFGMLAAEKGPYITNVPPNFPEDHAADRIERCCKTQETTQAVHGAVSLDLKAIEAYVAKTDTVVACLPTIGYMNMPGPPNDCGGTMVCNGAVILTEDRIFMFGSNSNKEASASDFITGTTFCTYVCCCLPCCHGFCGCIESCKVTSFSYKQVALRENEDFQDSFRLSNAKVSIKSTSMTKITREYTAGKIPSDSSGKPSKSCCSGICEPFFYHGSHTFQYSDDGSQMKNMTIDSMSERTVGHDDMAWGLMDEMALASLLTDPKTKDLFRKDTNSLECRSLFLKKFGSKFSVAQCQQKVQNLTQGLKTKDLCTSKSVMTINITHWDAASQKIRTTVAVCDPSQVTPEDMMKFQVDASVAKNSMDDSLLRTSASDVAGPKTTSGFGGRGGGGVGGMLKGMTLCLFK